MYSVWLEDIQPVMCQYSPKHIFKDNLFRPHRTGYQYSVQNITNEDHDNYPLHSGPDSVVPYTILCSREVDDLNMAMY